MSNRAKRTTLGPGGAGLLFVVSAPAGTGKTTLVRLLIEEFAEIKASISCTTRPPRPGEKEGEHYHFLQPEEFRRRIAEGDFLEYAQVFDHLYGTSRSALAAERSKGHAMVLTIDTQGALQLRQKEPAVLIFIRPPSLEELRRRLAARKTESVASMEKRLSWAEKELAVASAYDYEIVNDDLEVAYEALRAIVIAEAHRIKTRVAPYSSCSSS